MPALTERAPTNLASGSAGVPSSAAVATVFATVTILNTQPALFAWVVGHPVRLSLSLDAVVMRVLWVLLSPVIASALNLALSLASCKAVGDTSSMFMSSAGCIPLHLVSAAAASVASVAVTFAPATFVAVASDSNSDLASAGVVSTLTERVVAVAFGASTVTAIALSAAFVFFFLQ